MKGPKNESISYLVKTRFQWGCDHSLLLVLHVTLKEEHTCTILINQNSLQCCILILLACSDNVILWLLRGRLLNTI